MSWNLELIAAKERLSFLEAMDRHFDFDFLLVQDWARECENVEKPSVGEFKVITVWRGDSRTKVTAIVFARRWPFAKYNVRHREAKQVAVDITINGTDIRLVSAHLATGGASVTQY